MKTSMTRRLLLVPALVVALLAPAIAYAQATPTLGELARKEEERRKALKAASTVVLTDKDVPRATTPAPQPAPAGEAPGEKPAEAAGEKPAEQAGEKPQEPVKDEAWWKERVTRVREELRRNEMFADALQTRINAFATDFASQDDPYRRAEIAQQRATAIAELDRVKADLDANRKAMAAIEEEARRASVPPGWLR
jgi:hypothetical protein